MPRYEIRNCTMEVHPERGVIYIHNQHGFTVLRIEQLPRPIPDVSQGATGIPERMLEIAHMKGCDWNGDTYYK